MPEFLRKFARAENFSFERAPFAIFSLFILSFVFSYPAIFQLSTHLISAGSADSWQYPWNIFIFREQILHGNSPYFTDYIYHPIGTSLVLHNNTEVISAVGLLLSPFLNEIATTNLMIIMGTFLTAVAAYLLGREITDSSIAGIYAAIAFAFCPFRMIQNLGHVHMALTQWMLFAFWSLFRMGETHRIRYAFLMGLFFALNYYSNYYYGIYLVLALSLLLIAGLWQLREWRKLTLFRNLGFAALCALLLLLPYIVHFLRDYHQGIIGSYEGEERFFAKTSATIQEYLRMGALNPFFRKLLGRNPVIWPYSPITSGWIALLIGMIGMVFAIRFKQRKLIVMMLVALGFFLLSFGPYWEFSGLHVPMPYALLAKIPFFSHARIPARFAVIVTLTLGLLGGYLLSLAKEKLAGRQGSILLGCIFVLLLLELDPVRVPMTAFDPPKIFSQISNSKEKIMLTIPFFPGRGMASRDLKYQMVYKKKVLAGNISRDPILQRAYFRSIPVAKSLYSMSLGSKLGEKSMIQDRKVVTMFRSFFDLSYVTLFPPFSKTPDITRYVGQIFPDAQLLSDQNLIKVYKLPSLKKNVFEVSDNDLGIRFFLFENWKVDRFGKRFGVVCYEDRAKLLLPKMSAGQIQSVQMKMRSIDPRIVNGSIRISVGDHILQELRLTKTFQGIEMEIPEEALTKSHQILDLELIYGQNGGKKDFESVRVDAKGRKKLPPKMELRSIKINIHNSANT